MPHKLSELNAMSEEQLRALGEKLNIKGAAKMDLPTLGFTILDTEAIIESQKPAEPKPAAKKRGRPKKEASKPVEAKPEVKPEAKPETPEPVAEEAPKAPKKRGRKPKAAAVAEAPAVEQQAEEKTEVKAEEVDGKQFIHSLFDDLKEDEAQKEELREKKENNNKVIC